MHVRRVYAHRGSGSGINHGAACENQLHTAEITGYTSDGAGVCHIAGRAVFVKGALAGETWQVRILKVTANAVYGKRRAVPVPCPGAHAARPARFTAPAAAAACSIWTTTSSCA
ncbi:MAG: TRAM domain-containing protein [Oscillospiraceae bacterium]